ncbi:DUF2306 domain-containing protein [Actinomycetospora aeridis]|uniref:DUF2306 domain-containing protein n=1 Tax=Actinomycetospora aeridis TaxID=3129231 RepID=A0ABU8N0B2_9PSEU
MTTLAPAPDRPAPRPGPAGDAATPWWRRPWVLPLTALVAAALVFMWASYITLDARTATVELPPEYPGKYQIVLAHIVFGTVALVAVVLQVWPWLRRRHPRVHRWVGRVYVVGGVAPSAALAAVLLPMIAGSHWLAWASRVTLEVLWVATTAVGAISARRRRWTLHRWAMLSSFALTMDAFSTRFLQVALMPLYPDVIDEGAFLLLVGWGGWVANLLLVQAWLLRSMRRSRRDRTRGDVLAA